MRKIVKIPSITVDASVVFFEDERPEEFAAYQAQRSATKQVWQDILSDPSSLFQACRFSVPGSHSQTLILAPSTRDGVDWQLSFFDADGIPVMHEDYYLKDNTNPNRSRQNDMEALLRRLTDYSLRGREVSVEVEYIEKEREVMEHEQTIVKVQSAARSNFEGYVSLVQFDRSKSWEENDTKVFLGKSENYDSRGNYDDSDNSLVYISNNRHIDSFLSSVGWTKDQQQMINEGAFTAEDYAEYASLKEGVLKQFEHLRTREVRFNIDIYIPGSGEEFRYPEWNREPEQKSIIEKLEQRLQFCNECRVRYPEYDAEWRGRADEVQLAIETLRTQLEPLEVFSNRRAYCFNLANAFAGEGVTAQAEYWRGHHQEIGELMEFLNREEERSPGAIVAVREGHEPAPIPPENVVTLEVEPPVEEQAEDDVINNFRRNYSFLSNYYAADVEYNGVRYRNSEAAFQAQKAVNEETRALFEGLNPQEARRLGRSIELRPDWETIKEQVMYEICKAKFEQHSELMARLLETGTRPLEEGNAWNDRFWGTVNGEGENKLGKILIRIREEARTRENIQTKPNRQQQETPQPQRQRLFVDMDGTLAVFTPTTSLETLYEEGYFRNLAPHENVVESIREIIRNHSDIEVYILSAYLTDSKYALQEKNGWLDEYLPEIDAEHRVFVPCGSDKKGGIPGGIRANDFLLDDYTKNLNDWQPPARGIKLLNAINHTRGSWAHDRIRYDRDPVSLANGIAAIMHDEQRIFDDRVTPDADREDPAKAAPEHEGTADREDSSLFQANSGHEADQPNPIPKEGVDMNTNEKTFIEDLARYDFIHGSSNWSDILPRFVQQAAMDAASVYEAYGAEYNRLQAEAQAVALNESDAAARLVVLTTDRIGERYAHHEIAYNAPMTPDDFAEYKNDPNSFLESVYARLGNAGIQPSDYYGHSPSIGDAIAVLTPEGTEIHYVDRFGFTQDREADHALVMAHQNAAALGMTVRDEYNLLENINDYTRSSGNERLIDVMFDATADRLASMRDEYVSIFSLADVRGVVERNQDKLAVLYEHEEDYILGEPIAYYADGRYTVTNAAIRGDIWVAPSERLASEINNRFARIAQELSNEAQVFYRYHASPRPLGEHGEHDFIVQAYEREEDGPGAIARNVIYAGNAQMAMELVNHLNAGTDYGDSFLENADLRRNLGMSIAMGADADRAAIALENETLEFDVTRRAERVVEAMEAAGYHIDDEAELANLVFRTDEGNVVGFAGVHAVEEWLEGVVFDDPDISDAVERIMHPERFDEPYVPVPLTADQQLTVNAMQAADFIYDPRTYMGATGEIVFRGDGENDYPLSFNSWDDARTWIASATFSKTENGSQIREAVQNILYPEFDAAEAEAIVGKTFNYAGNLYDPAAFVEVTRVSDGIVSLQSLDDDEHYEVPAAYFMENIRESMAQDRSVTALVEKLQDAAAAGMEQQGSPWGSWFGRISYPDSPEDYIELDVTGYSTRNTVIESATIVVGGNVMDSIVMPEVSAEDYLRGDFRKGNGFAQRVIDAYLEHIEPFGLSDYQLYAPQDWGDHTLEEHYELLRTAGFDDMPNYDQYNVQRAQAAEHGDNEPLVDISDLAYDDEGYLHFTVHADGYALEGLYRVYDRANGEDMELVSIDYGDQHPIIERQWDRIEDALYDAAYDRYNELVDERFEHKDRLVQAMALAGYTYNEQESTSGHHVFNHETDGRTFVNLDAAYRWLDGYMMLADHPKEAEMERIIYPEQYESPIGDNEWYYNEPETGRVLGVYYNPDSNAGGQFVQMYISYELIREAARECGGNEEWFFEYLEEHAYTELVDIDTLDFKEAVYHYKNNAPDFIRGEVNTMERLLALADAPQQMVAHDAISLEEGKTVYGFAYPDSGITVVNEETVESITRDDAGNIVQIETDAEYYDAADLGKTVFLTREEAQASLDAKNDHGDREVSNALHFEYISVEDTNTGWPTADIQDYGYINGYVRGYNVEFRHRETGEINYNSALYVSTTIEAYYQERINDWGDLGYDPFETERMGGWEPTGRAVFRGYGVEEYDFEEHEEFVKTEGVAAEIEQMIRDNGYVLKDGFDSHKSFVENVKGETRGAWAELLARRLDDLARDVDPYGYRDAVSTEDREAYMDELTQDILNGDISDYAAWMNGFVEENSLTNEQDALWAALQKDLQDFIALENPVDSHTERPQAITRVAIESTDDYTDPGFHKDLADSEIQNEDGSYGREVDYYRIVTIGEDGRLTPLNNIVFYSTDAAREAVSLAPDLELVNYDVLVKEAGDILTAASIARMQERVAQGTITFYVAESMEFPSMGEYYEGLTLQQAFEIYDSIPSERLNGDKGIGFTLHDGSEYDGNFGLLLGDEPQEDVINGIDHFRNSSLVQRAIQDCKAELERRSAAENQREDSGEPTITMDSDNIRVDGRRGTWYVIDHETINGRDLFLLESEQYGDEAASLIVDSHGELIMDDVWNGFDDYRDQLEAEQDRGEPEHGEYTSDSFHEGDFYEDEYNRGIITNVYPGGHNGQHAPLFGYIDPDAAPGSRDAKGYVMMTEVAIERLNRGEATLTPAAQVTRQLTHEQKSEQLSLFETVEEARQAEIQSQDRANQENSSLSSREPEQRPFISHYYVIDDLQGRDKADLQEFENLSDALNAYAALPSDKIKALGIQNTNDLPGILDFIQCIDGKDVFVTDYRQVAGWDNPEINHDAEVIEEAVQVWEIMSTYSLEELQKELDARDPLVDPAEGVEGLAKYSFYALGRAEYNLQRQDPELSERVDAGETVITEWEHEHSMLSDAESRAVYTLIRDRDLPLSLLEARIREALGEAPEAYHGDKPVIELEDAANLNGNPDGYRFFYAPEQRDEMLAFQQETGWRQFWGSEHQHLNGDSWVVYRSVDDLPVWLRDYANEMENISMINSRGVAQETDRYVELGYTDEQIEDITGWMENAPDYAVDILASKDFTYNQFVMIRYGVVENLDSEKFAILANPELGDLQMEEVLEGFSAGLTTEQVRSYATPELDPDEMYEARTKLAANNERAGDTELQAESGATEAAYNLGEDGYLYIQTTDGGYDYTLYDRGMNDLDGGRFDRPDLTLGQVRAEIFEMHQMNPETVQIVPAEEWEALLEIHDQTVVNRVAQELSEREPDVAMQRIENEREGVVNMEAQTTGTAERSVFTVGEQQLLHRSLEAYAEAEQKRNASFEWGTVEKENSNKRLSAIRNVRENSDFSAQRKGVLMNALEALRQVESAANASLEWGSAEKAASNKTLDAIYDLSLKVERMEYARSVPEAAEPVPEQAAPSAEGVTDVPAYSENEALVMLAMRIDEFMYYNDGPSYREDVGEAYEQRSEHRAHLAYVLEAGEYAPLVDTFRAFVSAAKNVAMQDADFTDVTNEARDLLYSLEHLDEYQRNYSSGREYPVMTPIREFYNEAGQVIEGARIPLLKSQIQNFSDRSVVYHAVRDFERDNSISYNQSVIDSDGQYEDKEILYDAYDRYVGMSHINDLSISSYMERLNEMHTSQRHLPLYELVAEVYYAQANGLNREQIDFIMDSVKGDRAALESMRMLRLALENGLPQEKVNVLVGEKPATMQWMVADFARGVSIEDVSALKGSDFATYNVVSEALKNGDVKRETAQSIVKAVNGIMQWNQSDFDRQFKENPNNVRARFASVDTEFFAEYLSDLAKTNGSVSPEAFSAIAAQFVEQRDTDSLKKFVEDKGGIKGFTIVGDKAAEKVAEPAQEGLTLSEEKKDPKEQLQEQLEQGVRNVLNSENFKNWLDTSKKMFMNNYSFNNAILVWIQKQDASYTMGFEQWKNYGRSVAKGAKSLKIFVPVIAYEKKDGDLWRMIKGNLDNQLKTNASLPQAVYRIGMSQMEVTMNRNGLFGLRVGGQERGILTEKQMQDFLKNSVIGKVPMYFSVGNVFDVKDTIEPEFLWMKKGFTKDEVVKDEKGNPVKNRKGETKIINTPERRARFQPHLDLSVPEKDPAKMAILYESLKAVSERNGIHVYEKARDDDDTLKHGADGYFSRDFSEKDPKGFIVMPTDLDATKKVSVMLHEMSHSELHGDLSKLAERMGEDNIPRQMREVQAEAVAYLVGQNFGIETDTSSFQYLAAYTQGFELQVLSKSIEVIYNECKQLTNELKAELALRGLNMDMSVKETGAMDKEAVQALTKSYVEYAAQQQNRISDIEKELPGLAQLHRGNDLAVAALVAQSLAVKQLKADTTVIVEQIGKLEDAATLNDQMECVAQMEAAKERMEAQNHEFSELSEHFREAVQNGRSLKDRFIADPVATIRDMGENMDYPQLAQLTNAQVQYLAKSDYVKQELAPLLRNDPQQFADKACERAAQIANVASKNGMFVEVTGCEQWTDEPIVADGAIMHPKVADSIVRQGELQIRSLRAQAEKMGDYFPYNKCQLMIYQAENGQIAKTFSTRVDIGDGSQGSLMDHLKQIKGAGALALTEEFEKATREKGAKDKIMFNEGQSLNAHAVGENEIETPAAERGMSHENWSREIAEAKEAAKEAAKEDADKSHPEPVKSNRKSQSRE